MLVLQDVAVSYGKQAVLRSASLECEAGGRVCVMGDNGAGKTTLLKAAAGMIRPTSGTVRRPSKTGFVPQDNGLLLDLTVQDNLLLWYAAWNRAGEVLFSKGSMEQRLGLAEYRKKQTGKLSGGLQKRLALACALAGEPKLLLLDEPFAGLDNQSRSLVVQLLVDFSEKGGGVVFSAHEPPSIAQAADRVVLLEQGRLSKPIPLGENPMKVLLTLLSSVET